MVLLKVVVFLLTLFVFTLSILSRRVERKEQVVIDIICPKDTEESVNIPKYRNKHSELLPVKFNRIFQDSKVSDETEPKDHAGGLKEPTQQDVVEEETYRVSTMVQLFRVGKAFIRPNMSLHPLEQDNPTRIQRVRNRLANTKSSVGKEVLKLWNLRIPGDFPQLVMGKYVGVHPYLRLTPEEAKAALRKWDKEHGTEVKPEIRAAVLHFIKTYPDEQPSPLVGDVLIEIRCEEHLIMLNKFLRRRAGNLKARVGNLSRSIKNKFKFKK